MIRAEEVLRAVANGKTLAQAGELIGVKSERARHLLNQICRKLGVNESILEIRADKDRCLAMLGVPRDNSIVKLNPKIATSLSVALKVGSVDDLNSKYVSNITAAQLSDAGMSAAAISDTQEWLVASNESLRRQPPSSESEIKSVVRAINILDAYHFDTEALRRQLAYLLGGSD